MMRSVDQVQPAPPPFFAAWRQMAAGRLAAARDEHAGALDAFLAAGRSHTCARARESRRVAMALGGRCGRPAIRVGSTGHKHSSTRNSHSPNASVPRARSGSPDAPPAGSRALRRR